jgi:hypothetical protein
VGDREALHIGLYGGEPQNVSEKIRRDHTSGNAGNVFFREVCQGVARQHLKEEFTAQFLRGSPSDSHGVDLLAESSA